MGLPRSKQTDLHCLPSLCRDHPRQLGDAQNRVLPRCVPHDSGERARQFKQRLYGAINQIELGAPKTIAAPPERDL